MIVHALLHVLTLNVDIPVLVSCCNTPLNEILLGKCKLIREDERTHSMKDAPGVLMPRSS